MPLYKIALWVLRWTFITIGALTTAVVVLGHLYAVNEAVYDPSLFAIGVAGLFAMGCGVMLMVLARNRGQRIELRRAAARCEELADRVWELKEAEARASNLLEAQGDLIVQRDAEGRITYANDAFCARTRTPREIMLGSRIGLDVLEQGDIEVLADGTRVHDQRIATPEGPRWLAWREVAVRSRSDERTEFLSVGRDVTDRTRAEQALAEARDAAEAASRAKSRFLAVMSHEIRTPLNGILGMADLLLDTPLTPEQRTYVGAAKTSGAALLSLIEEILDFSKIEAGRLDLQPQPFALLPLVEEVVELLAPRAQAKGLEIASDTDEGLPETFTGDAARLRQVLLNLAGNAIKFTETGGVGVTVERGAVPGEIVIAVRDTGIGIAPAEQARIFDEFEQAEGGSARKFGGTGLGLAISKRIVERMGGRIALDSAPEQGTTFRVSLPLAGASDAAAAATPDLAGRTILIVGAEGIEAGLLARKLTRWGAAATICDPQGATALLRERRWDALLADHALGAEAVARLAAEASPAAAQRIVLLAPGDRPGLDALKDAGFTGYLVKPVRTQSLASLLAGNQTFEHGARAAAPAPAAAPETARPHGLSVLIAEDNEINALLARVLVERLGHRPTLAATGEAALEAWHAARDADAAFDLVLMDVQMPGMDGLEATRRIRRAEAAEDGARTPVVALTANAFDEDREAALAAGMDGFLIKPLDRERLAAVLAQRAGRTTIAA